MELKATILEESGIYRYFDKSGTELFAGDTIRYDDGTTEKLFLSKEGQLGIDSTNPNWHKRDGGPYWGFGLYPLGKNELSEIEKVSE